MGRPALPFKNERIKVYKAKWRKNHKAEIQDYNMRTKDKAKVRGRKFYEKNYDKTIEKARNWAKENPEKHLKAKSMPHRIFALYRGNAKRRKKLFLLSLEDLAKIIKEPCFYCGIMPIYANGIDRKDNKVGYELTNCVSCCKSCNYMKNTSSIEDFLKKCSEIVEYQKRMKLPNNKNGTIQ